VVESVSSVEPLVSVKVLTDQCENILFTFKCAQYEIHSCWRVIEFVLSKIAQLF